MIAGARKAKTTFLTKLYAKAQANSIVAFPVPGEDVFLNSGIDLRKLNLEVSDSPRHANLLILLGNLPEDLLEKTAVVYAQMPRPRSLLYIGAGELNPLPEPDIRCENSPEDLKKALNELRKKIRSGSWSDKAEAFEPEFLKPEEDKHHHGHEGHDHGGDDHGGGGMMSMEMMTMKLPRSADGLPMEWNGVHFGPFQPGLPGGMDVHLQIDGDTVAKLMGLEGINSEVPKDLSDPDELKKLFPQEPHSYAFLSGKEVRLADLEKERLLNHLNWLHSFAILLGNNWLQRKARYFYLKFYSTAVPDWPQYHSELQSFTAKVKKLWLLKYKLKGKGQVHEADLQKISGPVARAAGVEKDLRSEIDAYSSLKFQPVSSNGNDCYSRLMLRLQEMLQSLELIEQAGEESISNSGLSQIETSRGLALLKENDNPQNPLIFIPPSAAMAEILPQLMEGYEIAEALINLASLDISPWQLQKRAWE